MVNIVPRHVEDQNLLLSELAGMYKIVVFTNGICNEHNTTKGELEVGCYNIEALQRSINLEYCLSLNHTHFDLTTAICHQVQNSPIKWKA